MDENRFVISDGLRQKTAPLLPGKPADAEHSRPRIDVAPPLVRGDTLGQGSGPGTNACTAYLCLCAIYSPI